MHKSLLARAYQTKIGKIYCCFRILQFLSYIMIYSLYIKTARKQSIVRKHRSTVT